MNGQQIVYTKYLGCDGRQTGSTQIPPDSLFQVQYRLICTNYKQYSWDLFYTGTLHYAFFLYEADSTLLLVSLVLLLLLE